MCQCNKQFQIEKRSEEVAVLITYLEIDLIKIFNSEHEH